METKIPSMENKMMLKDMGTKLVGKTIMLRDVEILSLEKATLLREKAIL